MLFEVGLWSGPRESGGLEVMSMFECQWIFPSSEATFGIASEGSPHLKYSRSHYRGCCHLKEASVSAIKGNVRHVGSWTVVKEGKTQTARMRKGGAKYGNCMGMFKESHSEWATPCARPSRAGWNDGDKNVRGVVWQICFCNSARNLLVEVGWSEGQIRIHRQRPAVSICLHGAAEELT